MRVRDLGSAFNVNVSRDEVADFRESWPCSRLPDKAICFQFSKSNGDLIDMWPNDIDGSAVLALSQDAQAYGMKKLGLNGTVKVKV